MVYFEALKQIKQKQFDSVYLLYGTESYLVQDIQQAIVQYGLTEEEQEVNLSIYDLEEFPIQEVVMDAETFPFFGERKILICKNASLFKAKPDKAQVEHDMSVLQQYLTEPVDYSILVFIAPYEKVDERKKVIKQIKQQGKVIPCQSLKEHEMSDWIQSIARELHINIESAAIDVFIQENGTNLMAIRNELQKMSSYVGDEGTITKDIAEMLAAHNPQASALKLVDAVMNQNVEQAILLYKDLEKQNEEPIALLALLASQFRLIYQSKLLKQKGYSQNQMAQQIKAHPFAIKMALKRERGFSEGQLAQITQLLTEADASMKQGKMEKNLSFELLLYELIHVKKNKK
ncbi:DNA polymerase III subunit delta [Pontibacillus yanchengensis]|uniref:DNA polymerase III subunit delta n=2 Tax=Pontibacillus yanchengensis TaxID=462910 RepID=A0ACC7VDF1_9BACI|nr:DNA polymerase III subunit delta [Pontibacillus yanchengensis]MYL33408.1 DNA polymerase III subunit delta [Pontibacillus yanchengensis]MYL53458.1 DNA polymerase III subunit delta [Pontibacillus yanchengensis]